MSAHDHQVRCNVTFTYDKQQHNEGCCGPFPQASSRLGQRWRRRERSAMTEGAGDDLADVGNTARVVRNTRNVFVLAVGCTRPGPREQPLRRAFTMMCLRTLWRRATLQLGATTWSSSSGGRHQVRGDWQKGGTCMPCESLSQNFQLPSHGT